MATINLSSEQLQELSRQLDSWRQEIVCTNSSIKSTISMVEGWKDPQYQMFQSAIVMTHNQLEQYCNSLETLSKNLRLYAEQQRDINSSFGSNIHSIH